jgi:2-hydroxychromene-2-carboxylate isomerase
MRLHKETAPRFLLVGKISGARSDEGIVLSLAQTPETKAELRATTEAAQAARIFGAPSFTWLMASWFWGDGGLERALAWSL